MLATCAFFSQLVVGRYIVVTVSRNRINCLTTVIAANEYFTFLRDALLDVPDTPNSINYLETVIVNAASTIIEDYWNGEGIGLNGILDNSMVGLAAFGMAEL